MPCAHHLMSLSFSPAAGGRPPCPTSPGSASPGSTSPGFQDSKAVINMTALKGPGVPNGNPYR